MTPGRPQPPAQCFAGGQPNLFNNASQMRLSIVKHSTTQEQKAIVLTALPGNKIAHEQKAMVLTALPCNKMTYKLPALACHDCVLRQVLSVAP